MRRAIRRSTARTDKGRAIVGFNATRVEQALAGLNVRIWGSERPLTLIWIAVDDGQGGRALLGSGDPPADATPAMVDLLAMLRTRARGGRGRARTAARAAAARCG